ncbi:MAG: hypothetical protein EOO12_00645 [Chitinophagaceae bacterium]|nr:MAG: hypothetical protein EOO12_00645 [Chitinophagaceae bacterium]
MRYLLFLLLAPVFANSQTIHLVRDKICYSGSLATGNADSKTLQEILKAAVLRYTGTTLQGQAENQLFARATMRLASPYHLVRTVQYNLQLTIDKNLCRYTIDSVVLVEKERGGPARTTTDADLLKNMDVSGAMSMNTEALLNEIDMRFQKLLDRLRNNIVAIPSK